MKWRIGMLAAIALPVAALAQPIPAPPPITATPLLPPSVQYAPPQMTPQNAPPPASGQTPALQPTDQTQTLAPVAPPGTAPAAPPASPQPMQLTWLPQASATVQVLDKVNAQNTVLTIKVGQQVQVGSLSIQVQACDIHPPDQPRDSAAYLTITDSRADTSGFHGWMLANDPSVSMLQHPIYDVRVVGCQA